MPVGPFTLYGAAIEALSKGTIDLDSNNFSVILVTNSYTPSVNVDDTYSDLSAHEVANGNGYTTRGINLGTLAVSRSGGTVTVDETTNPSWSASGTLTARYAVIAKRASTSLTGTDLLLGYVDLDTGGGAITVTSGGTLVINWNALGLFTLARAA